METSLIVRDVRFTDPTVDKVVTVGPNFSGIPEGKYTIKGILPNTYEVEFCNSPNNLAMNLISFWECCIPSASWAVRVGDVYTHGNLFWKAQEVNLDPKRIFQQGFPSWAKIRRFRCEENGNIITSEDVFSVLRKNGTFADFCTKGVSLVVIRRENLQIPSVGSKVRIPENALSPVCTRCGAKTVPCFSTNFCPKCE